MSKQALLVFAVFTCIVVIGYATHDPWRDELQAWNMARDMSCLDLIRNAENEGHPIGWHVLIKPLTLLDLPFESLRLMNFALVLATILLFFNYAPLSPWSKALLICTAPFVFITLNARVYSMVAFLLMLQSSLHRSRLRSPWPYALSLAALANTVVLCFPYVWLSAWLWLKSARAAHVKSTVFPAFCFLCAAFLGAIIQIVPSVSKADSMISSSLVIHVDKLMSIDAVFISCVIVIVIFFILAKYLWNFCADFALLVVCSIIFFLCIHFFVYALSSYHFTVLAFIIHASVWTHWDEIIESVKLLNNNIFVCVYYAMNVLAFIFSIYILHCELSYQNSHVVDTVPFVRKHFLNTPIAGHSMSKVSSLSALIPGLRIWSPVTQTWCSFAVFDVRWQKSRYISIDDVVTSIFEQCNAFRPILILSERWNSPRSHEYRLIFVADSKTKYDENFFIYVPLERMLPGMTILSDTATSF